MRRVRLQDVAAAAGCSTSTVSRVLSGRGQVGAELAATIREAAAALGYDPSVETRGRRLQPALQVLDLVLPQWDDPWASRVIAGAQASALSRGFDLVLSAERDDPHDDWPARAVRRGSAGVVAAMIRPTSRQMALLAAAGIPLVLIDPPTDPDAAVPIVATADWEGGFAAGQHLGSLQRTRAIALTGVPRFRWGRARLDGVREGIASVNARSTFEVEEIRWGAPHDVAEALLPVLESVQEPAVLFTNLDHWAYPAYQAARRLQLSIPRDLAVMGFDDEPAARYMRPPLTTMHQPLREIAAAAIGLVVDRSRGLVRDDHRLRLPSVLVTRGSTSG
ncbi:hypothetical protein ASF48_09090 [Rathayibacter sp. Leaf299]|nr:hypothetical protein ASF48_09090 [Rathayibacter sp. Leaf299]